jgi:hypothetical protein
MSEEPTSIVPPRKQRRNYALLESLKRIPGLQGLGGIAIMATVTLGCQGSGSFAKLQESLAQIDQKQDAILARLDQLEQKIGSMPAGAAKPGEQAKPTGPQPGRPDPAATYKVEVWPDDAAKGPADALVTVVEWSDFQ